VLKKVSIPLQVLDSMLTLSPEDMRSVLSMICDAAHADAGSPPFPERCAVWPDMSSEISRQHRAALSHARCGVRGGRPRREQLTASPTTAAAPDFDDGVTAFTASLEKPTAADAASYIVNSGFRMTPNYWDEFREFTEDSCLPDDLVIWACDKAAAKDAGWPYIKAILDRCITAGVTTLDQAITESVKHAAEVKAEKEKQQDTQKIKQVTAHKFPQRTYEEKSLEDQVYGDFLRYVKKNTGDGSLY
jgi:hypothetical protein